MGDPLLIASLLLGLSFVLALLAMLRLSSPADYMLSAQLLGSNGVGLLLLLSQLQGMPSLIDVALVLALLAAVVTIAFTRREVPDDA